MMSLTGNFSRQALAIEERKQVVRFRLFFLSKTFSFIFVDSWKHEYSLSPKANEKGGDLDVGIFRP